MNNIDLKLLTVIHSLRDTRSVSQTAANLNLTRSAVSMSLLKLREHFRDPLFIRTSNGMEPTPQAAALIDILTQAEDLLHIALDHRLEFDPLTSNRMFHLRMRDIGQLRLLPRLLKRLRELAPSARFDIQSLSEGTPKMLESGDVDLAVGFLAPLGAGFCQQTLFSDRFVCAFGVGHPRIADELTLEQFENELHLVVGTSGTGHSMIERGILTKGIHRKIGLCLASFLGVDDILAETDYIALVPEQMARRMAEAGKIRVSPLPFELGPYRVTQNWHERFSRDPANTWLRHVLTDVFLAHKERVVRPAARA